MNIHERIKLVRVLAGLSQAELADLMDCSQSAIARYEVDRTPASDSVFVALSRNTGFPVSYIKEGKLSGMVACRVERPGVEYPPFARRFAENTINNLLPTMFPKDVIRKVLRTTAQGCEAFVVYTNDFCVVLFARKLKATLQSAIFPQEDQGLINNSIDAETVEIDNEVFWNAYLQPEFDYLRAILECAGANEWQEKVEMGKFIRDEFEVVLEIKSICNNNGYNGSPMVQSVISTLKQALKTDGCEPIETTLVTKRLRTRLDPWVSVKNPEDIPGAPSNWGFKSQTKIMVASQETL